MSPTRSTSKTTAAAEGRANTRNRSSHAQCVTTPSIPMGRVPSTGSVPTSDRSHAMTDLETLIVYVAAITLLAFLVFLQLRLRDIQRQLTRKHRR